MAHLTIYLNDDTERRVRKAARAAKVSVSKWVAERVTKSVETSWPPEFLALAGSFADFPDAAQLRKGYGKDVPGRPSIDTPGYERHDSLPEGRPGDRGAHPKRFAGRVGHTGDRDLRTGIRKPSLKTPRPAPP